MKKAVILTLLCLASYSIFAVETFNNNKKYWRVAVKSCSGNKTVNITTKKGTEDIKFASITTSNTTSSKYPFSTSQSCSNGLSPLYYILDLGTDSMPTSVVTTINDSPTTTLTRTFNFTNYYIGDQSWKKDSNSTFSIQCKLSLWRDNNVSISNITSNDPGNPNSKNCQNDLLEFNNIVFFDINEALIINIYANGEFIKSMTIRPKTGSTFPYTDTYQSTISNLLTNSINTDATITLKYRYWHKPESTNIQDHAISPELAHNLQHVYKMAYTLNISKTDAVCSYNKGTLTINSTTIDSNVDPNITFSYRLGMDYTTTQSIVFKKSQLPKPISLDSGKYYYAYISDYYCLDTTHNKTFTINAPKKLELTTTKVKNTSCTYTSDGEITFTAKGGTLNYTINLTDDKSNTYISNINTFTFSNLPASIYKAKVTDSNKCFDKIDSIKIIKPNVFAMFTPEVTSPICKEVKDGTITIKLDPAKLGNEGKYQYEISDNYNYDVTSPETTSTSYTFNNLDEGDYFLLAYDAEKCTTAIKPQTLSYQKRISISIAFDSINSTQYAIRCANGSDGVINAIPKSVGTTTTAKSFEWNKIGSSPTLLSGHNSDTILNRNAGQYFVHFTDTDKCTATSNTIELKAPSEILKLALDTSSNNNFAVSCFNGFDGTIKASAKGGFGQYKFAFDNDNNYSAFRKKTSDTTYTGNTAKTYTIYIKDTLDCKTSKEITLHQPTQITIETWEKLQYHYNNDISCAEKTDGRIALNIYGGIEPYSDTILFNNLYHSNPTNYQNTPATIGNLSLGSYTLKGRDKNKCPITSSKPITITSKPAPLQITTLEHIPYPSKHSISCFGYATGKIKITISGGTAPYFITVRDLATNAILSNFNNYRTNNSLDTLKGFKAGAYIVQLTDTNNCNAAQDTITLNQPDSLYITINNPKYKGYYFRCYGMSDTIKATAHEGGGGYSFSWGNDDNFSLKDSLVLDYKSTLDKNKKQNYKVYAKDMNDCPANFTLPLNQPDSLYLTPTFTIPTCFYDSDGLVNVKATGGVQDIMSYRLFRGNGKVDSLINSLYDTAQFNNLKGKYVVKITDGNNCPAKIDSLDIQNYDTIKVVIDSVKIPSCYGGTDAALKIKGVNGKKIKGANYFFKIWNSTYHDSITSNFAYFDSLSATSYTFLVKDQIGCKDTDSYLIESPRKMEMQMWADTNRCFEDHNAGIHVRAFNGYGGYKFAYQYLKDTMGFHPTNTNDTLKIHNLDWNIRNSNNAVLYKVYLRDSHFVEGQPKCIVSDTFTLPVVPNITYLVSTKQPSCYNTADGSASIEGIEGGRGKHAYWDYIWTHDLDTIKQNNTRINNLSSGIYKAFIIDSVKCKTEAIQIELLNPIPFTANVMGTTKDLGYGGSVNFKLTGLDASLRYSYFIDNGTTEIKSQNLNCDVSNPIFTGFRTGKHKIRFKTSKSCEAVDSFRIFYPNPIIELLGTMPAGIGAANGSALVKASKDTGQFTYKWIKSGYGVLANTSTKAAGLSSGVYKVFAIDSDGISTDTLNFSIGETEQLSVGIDSIADATCPSANNGYAKISVRGLHPLFLYSWKNEAGQIVSNTSSAQNLAAGKYKVEVTDTVGSVVIKEIIVGSGLPLSIVSVITNNASCFGTQDGMVEITSRGGSGLHNIIWDNGHKGNSINGLKRGNYSAFITDSLSVNCKTSKTITINEPERLRIDSVKYKKPTCYNSYNGALSVTAKGGTIPYNFYWPSKNINYYKVTNLTPGIYNVELTDGQNCTFDTTVVLPDTLPIEFATVIKKMPLCYGQANGEIQVQLKNGKAPYLINWPSISNNTQGNTVTGLASGIYNIHATDFNGCKFSGSVVLSQPKSITIDSFSLTEPKCSNSYDGSINVMASGGTNPLSYRWNNTQINTNLNEKLISGTYSLVVKDKNLCSIGKSFNLPAPAPVDFSIVPQEPKCFGLSNGSLTIVPTGGTPAYSYLLGNNKKDSIISSLYSNIYQISIFDKNQCFAEKSFKLLQPDELKASYAITNEIKCAGNCEAGMEIRASGGINPYWVLWPDSSFALSKKDLCAGNFVAILTDANLCPYNIPVEITEPYPIVMLSSKAFLPTCFQGSDGKLTATFFGGTYPFTKTWSNGSVGDTAINLAAGTYTVTVKDSNNCGTKKVISLPNQIKESISNVPEMIKMCEKQSKTLDPGLWASYKWTKEGIEVGTDKTYTIDVGGKYLLDVVSLKGCKDSRAFTVEYVKNLLRADFLIANDAIVGENVDIIDITWPLPEKINWRYNSDSIALLGSGDDRQRISFKYPGVYNIKLVAQSSSCIDSTYQTINIYSSENELKNGKRQIGDSQDIIELTIYPNPNKGEFNTNLKLKQAGKAKIEIAKIVSGAVIYQKDFDGSDAYTIPINIAHQAAGVYCLRITTANQQKQFLFVIL